MNFKLKTCDIRDRSYHFCALRNNRTKICIYDLKNRRRSEREPTRNRILWLQIKMIGSLKDILA